MSPLRRAALRLEMAEGRVQALRQLPPADPEGQPGPAFDPYALEVAVDQRDGSRSEFRLELQAATGLDPTEITRLLAL